MPWCIVMSNGDSDRVRCSKLLKLISKAWTTPDDDGYCVFMPWIPGDVPPGEKRGKYWQESDAFRWPADRERILDHMLKHEGDDLFWTPVLYDGDRRVKELVAENHCLYADLDEADPRGFEKAHDLKPTVAWETSPGRYQALWIMDGDIVGASDEGAENHRLTYLLGADHGGWDSTQVLRIPLWYNHKAEYRELYGEEGAAGRLLWSTGPIYDVRAFDDLPEVLTREQVEDVLDDDISAVNWRQVYDRVKLRLTKRVREWLFVTEEQPAGERNEVLWQMERSLADAGCTAAEIVALVRRTGWNKYVGRADEMLRLKTEAAKAVAERPEQVKESLEEERDMPEPVNIWALVSDIQPPNWMVEEMWGEGSRGFVAGDPKSFKTFVSLDFAISVASGLAFLGEYKVRKRGKVLLIQEEDSPPMMQQRMAAMSGKHPHLHPKGVLVKEGRQVIWHPPMEIPLDILCGMGLDLSNGSHLIWLKDVIERHSYDLVIIDPFNFTVGEVEIERAEITPKILRPMVDVVGDCGLMIVHHMKKTAANGRGGARMLGSTALHGWTREAFYLTLGKGFIDIGRESKNAAFRRTRLAYPPIKNHLWTPEIIEKNETAQEDASGEVGSNNGGTQQSTQQSKRESAVAKFLQDNLGEEFSQAEIAKFTKMNAGTVSRQVKRLEEEGKITKTDSGKWVWK